MERLTITRTRRWGNSEIQIKNVIINEEIEYEVLCSRDNGTTEFIHRVEKKGKRSI